MSSESLSLHLLLPIALVPAILLGQIFRRFGLPAVVGQIAVGVVLGPVGIHLIAPLGIGEEGSNGFHELAEIGLCVLLFKIGLETRVKEFTRVWRPAVSIALLGMFIPFGAGFGLGTFLEWGVTASLFLGAALTATSIGVTAAVIGELGIGETREARLIMGAAVLDDVLGLLLLSSLTVISQSNGSVLGSVGSSFFQASLFLGLALIGGPVVVKLIDLASERLRSELVLLSMTFGFLLLMAYFAEEVGLAAIIGSYAAGLVFSERDQEKLERGLTSITELFAPIFFILIGSSISFADWSGWGDFAVIGAMIVLAVLSKLIPPFIVPGIGGNAMIIGSGLIPRGEVGLLFAQVGLSASILTAKQYSLLAIVLVATTVAGPLLLRLSASSRISSNVSDPVVPNE